MKSKAQTNKKRYKRVNIITEHGSTQRASDVFNRKGRDI
jgi:hypothetical protein